MFRLSAITAGVILDWIFGDPRCLPHPVVMMGRLVGEGEKRLCRPGTPGERMRGVAMTLLVLAAGVAVPLAVLFFLSVVEGKHGPAAWCLTAFWSFQLLAARGLFSESGKVRAALESGRQEEARYALSMIVGRDTENLDEGGAVRAAVETVGENTADGVIAPLLYMAVFGIAGGFFYKAVNTMDSMVGYKNERYRDFGRAAAKLDDFCSWIPARASGCLLVLAAWIMGFFTGDRGHYDGKNAWRIFCRDRRNHTSPNSAHGEAACAGALHIRLGGDSRYSGKLVRKPWIGDPDREGEAEDIRRAGKLMLVSEILCLLTVWAGYAAVFLIR